MEDLKEKFMILAAEYFDLCVKGNDEAAKRIATDMAIFKSRARAKYIAEHGKKTV